MKLKKITLGMGFGNYWNNADNIEKNIQASTESENNFRNLISMLIGIVKEQKSMIEQQQSDIQEMKMMMKEIKQKADVFLRVEAYQVDN